MSDKFCQICGAWMWPWNESNTSYSCKDCDNELQTIDQLSAYVEGLYNEMIRTEIEKEEG